MQDTQRLDKGDGDFEEPPHLRRLRWMVMALILVLILGVLSIAATIVIRLGLNTPSEFKTNLASEIDAEQLILPSDAEIVAVGAGPDVALFVVRDRSGAERLVVLSATTGEPVSTTPIVRR